MTCIILASSHCHALSISIQYCYLLPNPFQALALSYGWLTSFSPVFTE